MKKDTFVILNIVFGIFSSFLIVISGYFLYLSWQSYELVNDSMHLVSYNKDSLPYEANVILEGSITDVDDLGFEFEFFSGESNVKRVLFTELNSTSRKYSTLCETCDPIIFRNLLDFTEDTNELEVFDTFEFGDFSVRDWVTIWNSYQYENGSTLLKQHSVEQIILDSTDGEYDGS